MAEILLVNPRRRRRKAKKARRRRNPVAFLNPRRRRRNPKHRHSGSVRKHRRRANPSRRAITRGVRHVRRRRNPSLRGLTGGVMPTLKAGLIGATGAIGLDVLWGQAAKVMPASIAGSALAQYAAKLVGALLVGWAGGKILRGRGAALANGAATVVLHDALKAQLQASAPTVFGAGGTLALGEYLTYAPSVGSMRRAGPLLSTGMGEYLSGIPNTGSGGTNDDMSYTGEWNGDGMNGF